jgi:hypothetical protein
MESIGCPETSVTNYQCMLRKAPEECWTHLHRCARLKSHISHDLFTNSELQNTREKCYNWHNFQNFVVYSQVKITQSLSAVNCWFYCNGLSISSLRHWCALKNRIIIPVILNLILNEIMEKYKKVNYYLQKLTNIAQFRSDNWAPVTLAHILTLTIRWLMSYIYGAPIPDVSRSHTTTQHSR